MTEQNDQPTNNHSSILSFILRLFWMLLGNAILFVSMLLIFQSTDGKFHIVDTVFWVTTASLVIARYLDIKFYNGHTATGEPADMSHWRGYTIILLVCSAVLWVLLHAINYPVVNK